MINKEATEIIKYYRNVFMKDEQYEPPYNLGGKEIMDAWELQPDDIVSKAGYSKRHALISVINERVRLSNRRQMTRLIEKGCIEPMVEFTPEMSSDEVFVHKGLAYQLQDFDPQKDKFKVGTDRAKFLENRVRRVERMFNDHFVNPRVWCNAHILSAHSGLPSLGHHHMKDPHSWNPLQLNVHTGWDKMQQLSTSKHLFAARIHSKCEDEILDDDVRVCDVWAWEKKAVRDFFAVRNRIKEDGEPDLHIPLVPLVLAYNYTSSSLVSNRSRAIQSIKKKTKNRVTTSLWG